LGVLNLGERLSIHFNLTGEVMKSEIAELESGKNVKTIITDQLSPGLYILKISDNERFVNIKFIKQR
jgi:hypothetical protein